jgi:uncharacterized membrane protein
MTVEYERTVEIAAPAEAVWPVMSDIERWPAWTASVSEAELLDDGGLRPGQRARLRQPRLPAAIWTVDEVEPGRTFGWRSHAAGLHSRGEHTVEPTGTQTSRVVLRLSHSGALAGLARIVYGGLIRRYVGFEADGLKREAESRWTTSS